MEMTWKSALKDFLPSTYRHENASPVHSSALTVDSLARPISVYAPPPLMYSHSSTNRRSLDLSSTVKASIGGLKIAKYVIGMKRLHLKTLALPQRLRALSSLTEVEYSWCVGSVVAQRRRNFELAALSFSLLPLINVLSTHNLEVSTLLTLGNCLEEK